MFDGYLVLKATIVHNMDCEVMDFPISIKVLYLSTFVILAQIAGHSHYLLKLSSFES